MIKREKRKFYLKLVSYFIVLGFAYTSLIKAIVVIGFSFHVNPIHVVFRKLSYLDYYEIALGVPVAIYFTGRLMYLVNQRNKEEI